MRTRLMRTTLRASIFMALFSVAVGSAFGQKINPRAVYQITAKHSGKCLDVAGGSVLIGAPVIQWDCNGLENQQWTFTPIGAGYYKIIARHSGKALDVLGGELSVLNGVIVEQWDYNGGANQRWSVEYIGDGYYRIVAMHSGKCLDILGALPIHGALADQWGCTGGDNQKWRLTEIHPYKRP